MSIPRLGDVRVVVVGSVNIDRVTQVDRFPLPGETIVGRGPDTFVGGKGANQASAIAQLIGRCVLVGAVGNDADGTRALQELRARGVDTTPVAIHPELPTGSAHIMVDAQGENTIVIHPGANAATAPAGTAVEGRGVCVLSLEIGVEAATHAASAATGTVILNASPAQPLPPELLKQARVVIVNETERALMPGVADAPVLITTLGSRGADVFENGIRVAHVDSPAPETVASTVGAGDAFCGAIAAAIASGLGVVDAVRIACAVGSAAVAQSAPQPLLNPLQHYAEDHLRVDGATSIENEFRRLDDGV